MNLCRNADKMPEKVLGVRDMRTKIRSGKNSKISLQDFDGHGKIKKKMRRFAAHFRKGQRIR